jgi:hypothetical protein
MSTPCCAICSERSSRPSGAAARIAMTGQSIRSQLNNSQRRYLQTRCPPQMPDAHGECRQWQTHAAAALRPIHKEAAGPEYLGLVQADI